MFTKTFENTYLAMFVVRERVVFQKVYAFKWEYLQRLIKNYSKEDGISINNLRFYFNNYFLPNTRILLNCFYDSIEVKHFEVYCFYKYTKNKIKFKQRLCVGTLLVIVFINFFFLLANENLLLS